MARVLINFAHPALEKSRMHAHLVPMIKSLPDITFNDLYEHYPDLDVNVAREQELLSRHEIILMQHPMYWYNAPAIVRQWQDLVLEHGWAYGHTGNALKGKYMSNIISAGSRESEYRKGGRHGFPLQQFLLPFTQTAILCNMNYISPYIIYGVHRMDKSDIIEEVQRLKSVLQKLTSPDFDLTTLDQIQDLNELIQEPIQKA
ncbi:glutathione-regulated potassium-efflux system ancillary protein KefG [Chitinophaga dinghuensis]|uniref:Glutathione-regulated potassium-efflux system ancillary protein KefG n=1 Tax=Chitinophaga dinghuensis TaxID=1539050 RepID=A0A327W488_9BACT|nr:NAD(P)H-dependent oxidoreductase [Chitinophaga dinghuensis]RAJ85307.1 glutathione-regulated potassium-efflux system ancillary protein KefG [Chitinophaga dinghuensis]